MDDDARGSTKRVERSAGIDLLRGLSIVLVVLHHIGLRIPLGRTLLGTFVPERILNGLIYNGSEAVFIFFVISGFLITLHSVERWGELSKISPRAFYARRVARIAPCLLALVAVLGLLHLGHATDYAITKPNQSLPRAIGAALGLHLNWYEGQTGYLPANWDVLWSLSIEELFYLAFPMVCLLLRRDWLLVPALGALAISLPTTRAALAANEVWQEKAYLPGMAAIATGVISALVVTKLRRRPRIGAILLLTLGTLGVGAVLFAEDLLWPTLGNGTFLVLTTAAGALLVGISWSDGERILPVQKATAWLRSFGRLSYETYLTHMFVVLSVLRVWKATGGGLRYGFVWYLPAVALSWWAGSLVARFYGAPANRRLLRALLPAKDNA